MTTEQQAREILGMADDEPNAATGFWTRSRFESMVSTGSARGYLVLPNADFGYLLELRAGGKVVGEMPFESQLEAVKFGHEYVERGRAMDRHPSGKRLVE